MTRESFVRRWYRRAARCKDPFDRFFSAWIALVILARSDLDEQGLSQPDVDRKAIIQYFESHALVVTAVLRSLSAEVSWLAKREGTGTREAILDVHGHSPRHLRQLFDTLARVWSGKAARKPRWVAGATAEMVNHIRNNMFHGLKAPDDTGDRDLLERVTPMLIRILEASGHAGSQPVAS